MKIKLDEVKGMPTNKVDNPNKDKAMQQAGGPQASSGIVVYDLFDELGATGTKIFSGIIDDEYLKEWKDLTRRCHLIKRMLQSDATVRAVYLSIVLPLESARWSMDIDEDADDLEKEIRDQAEDMLFQNMTTPWQDTLRQILTCMPYGFSVFEKVWTRNEKKKMVMLSKLAPRLQKTIKKWLTDESGGLAGIEQRAYYIVGDKTVFKTVNIPVEKLVVFSYRQEGSAFDGESIIRPAYKHWFIKDKLYLIQSIGLERHALGVPVITMPRSATKADINAAKRVVKSWRSSHEEAGAVFPEGVKLENITGTIQSQVLEQAITHHDSQIAKSVLAQFMQLGQGGTGSWALSKDHSDFFLMSLNGMAQFICDRISKYVIEPWVKLNWGERKFYPYMKCEEISKTSNMETLQAVQRLMQMGLVQGDMKLEEWARKAFNLPAKDEPSLEDMMDQLKSAKEEEQLNQQSQVPDNAQRVASTGNEGSIQQQQKQPALNNRSGSKESVKAEEPKVFDMAMNSYKFKEDRDILKDVKRTIYDIIQLKDQVAGIRTDNPEDDIDQVLEKAFNETIHTYIPPIIREFNTKFGTLDSKLENGLQNIYIDNLRKVTNPIRDQIKELAIKVSLGQPIALEERINRSIKLEDINAHVEGSVFGGDYNPAASAIMDNVNTQEDKRDKQDEQYNMQNNHLPSPYERSSKAPIFRDNKTGRYKYAKGAIINGQHVGGQWADIGAGIGIGGTAATAAIAIFGKSMTNLGGKRSKYGILNGLDRLWKTTIDNNPTIRAIYDKFGYHIDRTTYAVYKQSPAQLNHLFENTTSPGETTYNSIANDINKISGFRKPKIPSKNAIPDETNADMDWIHKGDLKPAFENVDAKYRGELTKDVRDAYIAEGKYEDLYHFKGDSFHVAGPLKGKLFKPGSNRIWWDKTWSAIEEANGVKDIPHLADAPKGYLDNLSAEEAATKTAAMTLKDAIRVKRIEWLRWYNRDITSGTVHEGMDVGVQPLDKHFKEWAKHNNMPETESIHGINLEDLIKAGDVDAHPNLNPIFDKLDKEGNIIKKGIHTVEDMLKDHHIGIAGLKEALSKPTASHIGHNWMSIPKIMEGGLKDLLLPSFIGLTSVYAATHIIRAMTKGVQRKLQDKVRTANYNVLTPQDAERYNSAWDDWNKMNSPTGGAIGRPRTRVEIPTHLKRQRGRPSFAEAKQEAIRKHKIEEIKRQWQIAHNQSNQSN